MLKTVDLNPDYQYEESNSDFIHQILGLGKDVCCYKNHFKGLEGFDSIVEVIEKIDELMDKIYDIDVVSNEIEPLLQVFDEKVLEYQQKLQTGYSKDKNNQEDSELDLELMRAKSVKEGNYDQRWVESKEDRLKLKKDKKFPFYYEGTLINEFIDRSYSFDSWADESLERFNSIDLSNKLKEISNLLESTEDLFEEFLDFHGISIYDHPYWNNRYRSFEDLNEIELEYQNDINWENQDSESIILENQELITSTNLTDRSYHLLLLTAVTLILIL